MIEGLLLIAMLEIEEAVRREARLREGGRVETDEKHGYNWLSRCCASLARYAGDFRIRVVCAGVLLTRVAKR